jgi:PAS domain S-box-containing protein
MRSEPIIAERLGTGATPLSTAAALCQANPLPCWICAAADNRLLAINEAALRYFGCDLPQGPTDAERAALAELADGRDAKGPHRFQRRDGGVLTLRLASNAVTVDGKLESVPAISIVALDMRAEAAWRECDRRFRQLFETASDWCWETDRQGVITYVSPNFAALYGASLDDMLGRRLQEVSGARIDPETEQTALAAVRARLPFRDMLYAHEFADGRNILVKTSAVPAFDAEGAFSGYWGVSKDVTAEIEAEHRLRDSERQFREILEASADFYWEQNAHYLYSYVSSGWERLIGPFDEAVGARLMDIPGITVDPEMGKMVLRQMKAKLPYRDFVFGRVAADGRQLWFKASGSPNFDRNGVFAGYRGAGADITQQMEVQAAARLAQQQLNEAVAHITQPIVVYDLDRRVMAFNQAFTELHQKQNVNTPVCLGASVVELAEWRLRYGFYADGEDDPKIELATLVDHYQSEDEQTYHLQDGRWMMVIHRSLPGDGRVGLWTDITAIKRAEEQRRALERQMYHSQRLEALGTLAGGAAHEINNALVPVIALTKMVAKRLPGDSRDRHNLQTALGGAERACDLVKQILAFSRKEIERPQQSVDVGMLVHEALRLMRVLMPSSIRLSEEIMPVPVIAGDPSQLHQVVMNLVTNAAQAIGEAPGSIAVGVHADPDDSAIRLTVQDSGCGMDEATMAHIFEPFFTTKPVGEGTGLGLSVAHGIIKAHNGHIGVNSAPGQGARFEIVLPVSGTGTRIGAAAAS